MRNGLVNSNNTQCWWQYRLVLFFPLVLSSFSSLDFFSRWIHVCLLQLSSLVFVPPFLFQEKRKKKRRHQKHPFFFHKSNACFFSEEMKEQASRLAVGVAVHFKKKVWVSKRKNGRCMPYSCKVHSIHHPHLRCFPFSLEQRHQRHDNWRYFKKSIRKKEQ